MKTSKPMIRQPDRRTFGQLMGVTAGVMVFITLAELIPMARAHGHQHYTAFRIILGTVFVFILSGVLDV